MPLVEIEVKELGGIAVIAVASRTLPVVGEHALTLRGLEDVDLRRPSVKLA
jgi:hypothetical protein